MIKKHIKRSDRGLTFSFSSNTNKKFSIGSLYKYIVDIKGNKIYILPSLDKESALKISRKKTSREIKSLVDLRSKKVKNVVYDSDYLEVIIKENIIIIEGFIKDNNKLKSKGTIKINLSLLNGTPINETNAVFKVISVFSGVGMMDYPLKLDKSFEILRAIEFDKAAAESYKTNIGDIVINDDIRNIESHELPDADVLWGGTVCCGFSNANRRKRLQDHEGSELLLEYIRFAKEKNFKVWVMENVAPILTVKNSHYYRLIKEQLSDYSITPIMLKDNELGGYTTRKRVFIIGSKIGAPIINITKKAAGTVKEALSKVTDRWYNFNDYTIPKESTVEKMKYIAQGSNWESVPEGLRSESWSKGKTQSNTYRRLDFDKPSVALANFRKCVLIHPVENRIISVAEASALSGFDESFVFKGTLSEKQLEVCNGVTFLMASTIKDIVKNILLKFSVTLKTS